MKVATKKSIIRDFDKAAKNYDEYAVIQRKAADRLFDLCKSKINNIDVLLDAGCGTGYFHELLRKNSIYCPLIQADISYKMCQKADLYSSPIEYGGTYSVNSDIEKLPFRHYAFNLIFSSLALQWSANISSSFSEMYRVLNNDGYLFINILAKGTLFELADSFKQLDGLEHINNNFVTTDSVYKEITSCGFKNVEILEETIVQNHNNVRDLMLSIKGVGANYKAKRLQKYPGKDYFNKLDEIYRSNFKNQDGLPASWKVIYVRAEK